MAHGLGPVLLVAGLYGCAGTASVLEQLAKDPSSACLAVSSAGTSVVVARAGSASHEVTAGPGGCTVRPFPTAKLPE